MTGPILITGSRGFLASHLASELRRRGRQRKLALWDRGRVPGHTLCDLEDPAAVYSGLKRLKPSLIYHLAGTTRPAGWDALWRAHPAATMTLLESISSLGLSSRVWIAGSAAEYGDLGAQPLSETAEPRPVTVYGATKWAQSLAALSYRRQGLNVSVARIFNLLGPGMPQHLSLGSFCRQIARIEAGLASPRLFVGNLQTRRDYIDVRDAVKALADLARLKEPAAVTHVSSGKSHSMAALLGELLAQAKVNIQLVKDPKRFKRADVKDCVGSYARLAKATGWRPLISIGQSLSDTLDWHRDAIAR